MERIPGTSSASLQGGERSDPIVHYLPVGASGFDEAHALAPNVTTALSLPESCRGKPAGAWVGLKSATE